MARIRTVKPEFFRDEDLQDLERAHPGKYAMLVFAGLWGHCDKSGNFEWKPRMLKLDILPFLDFEMADTLGILADAGFVVRYSSDGKDYGHVPKFLEHQRISGKEAQEPAKHPRQPKTQPGSVGEAPEKHPGGQEGKGREEERKEDYARSSASSTPQPVHVEPSIPLSPVFIALPVNAGKPFEIREAAIVEWEKLYPAVDVRQQLRTMRGWLDANPKRRKTVAGVKRFVNNWLAKDQNSGGQVARSGPGQRPRFDDGVPTVHVSRVEDIA